MYRAGLSPSQASLHPTNLTSSDRVFCLSITAKADPSTLPRILDIVAMFNVVPERCHVSRADDDPRRPLLIDLQLTNLSDDDAHRIGKKLERMVLVTQILWSNKRQAVA